MIYVAPSIEDPDEAEVHARCADELTTALQKGVPGAYVNFLAEDSPSRIREAHRSAPGRGYAPSSAPTTPPTWPV